MMVVLSVSLASVAFAMSKKQATQSYSDNQSPTVQTPPDMLWVGKSDQAKMCAKERGIDADLMAAGLKKANIQIASKKKLHDTKMRIQECGTDKGDMNGFLISKRDLDKAKELGFTPVSSPSDDSRR